MQETLETIKRDDIRVYFVWEPIWGADEMEDRTRRAAAPITDRRIVQYWTDSLAIGNAFTGVLRWGTTSQHHAGGPTPWDVYLLYPKTAKWSSGVPKPAAWVSPVVRDESLAEKIKAALSATQSPTRATTAQ